MISSMECDVLRKTCYAIGLVFLMLLAMSTATVTRATTQEPEIMYWGNVVKSVDSPPIGLFKYLDDEDESQSLGYSVNSDENVTFSRWDLELADAFANNTIGASTKLVADEFSLNAGYYRDSSDIPYILVKMTNTSNLVLSTQYYGNWTLDVEEDVHSTDYIAAMVTNGTWTESAEWARLAVWYHFDDEGGENHTISYRYGIESAGEAGMSADIDGDGKSDDYQIYQYDAANTVFQRQHRISFFDDELSVKLVKLTGVAYNLGIKTSDPMTEDSYETAWKVRVNNVFGNEIKIESQSLNGTDSTMTFEADAAFDSTEVITAIGNMTIPFIAVPQVTSTYDDANFGIDYQYNFLLPDDAALSYNTVKINFTMPSGTVDSLKINGDSYKTKTTNKDAGDEVTLLSSVAESTAYVVDVGVTYTEAEYYDIAMGISVTWYTPSGVFDKILAFLLAISNAIGGFGASTLKRTRARIRTP